MIRMMHVIAAGVVLSAAATATADTWTWTGGAEEEAPKWFTCANWVDTNGVAATAFTSGDTFVFNQATPLTVDYNSPDENFVVSNITFGASAAAVTITGNTITGVVTIANQSSAVSVFRCPVVGGAMTFNNTSTHCEFLGGITLSSASFTGANNTQTRALIGNWHFTGGWTPVANNSVGLSGSVASCVTVGGELLNSVNLIIESGNVVTAASFRVTNSYRYPADRNDGRLVINGWADIANTTSDFRFSNSGSGTVIIGGLKLNTGKWPELNAKTFVIGSDGITYKKNQHVYFTGTPTLYARDNALSLADQSGWSDKGYGIPSGETWTVCTTKFETEDPATITFNGWVFHKDKYIGKMRVTGKGKVVVNKDFPFQGTVTVTDTATLAVKSGCLSGKGLLTIDSKATYLISQSGTASLAGNLTLNDGAALGFHFTNSSTAPVLNRNGKTLTANGTVVVKISANDGVIPKQTARVLTSGGGFQGKKVVLAQGAPKWAARVVVNEDGNIAFVPPGLSLVVR